MNRLLVCLLLPLVAGCLTTTPPEVRLWTVDLDASAVPAKSVSEARDGVRLSQIHVRAPYDAREFVVMRENGSLAFDAYNQFAASPASILKGVLLDAIRSSGIFSRGVSASSLVSTPYSIEAQVTRLALDCRKPDARRATVELTLLLLKDRDIVSMARASAQVDAEGGDYSRAFSQAFSQASFEAIRQL